MGLFADRRRLSRWRRIADGCGHQSCQHETSRCPRLTEPYLSKPSIISSGRAMKFEINVRHQRAAAKVLAGDYLRLSSTNSSSSTLASFRSGASKPSVNKLWTGARSSRALVRLPWSARAALYSLLRVVRNALVVLQHPPQNDVRSPARVLIFPHSATDDAARVHVHQRPT
jgi:hypothetical protein